MSELPDPSSILLTLGLLILGLLTFYLLTFGAFVNPYEILSVPRPATDVNIRKAYLKLIQEFTPDRAPERFKQIANAYEEIKNSAARIEYLVFNRETSERTPAEVLLEYSRSFPKEKINLDKNCMKDFLQLCAKKTYSKT